MSGCSQLVVPTADVGTKIQYPKLRGGKGLRRRKNSKASEGYGDTPSTLPTSPNVEARQSSPPAFDTPENVTLQDPAALLAAGLLQRPSTPPGLAVLSASSSPLSSAPSSPVWPTPSGKPIKAKHTLEEEPSIKAKRRRINTKAGLTPSTPTHRPSAKISPYFPPAPKQPRQPISCIPFPPLTSTTFGLVQESLSSRPFHLLLAVIFLNKTRGAVAMPVFYRFIARFPTPASLAAAEFEEVVSFFQNLGLQNQRAKKCIALSQAWLVHPPAKGKRWRRLHYPMKGDGKDIPPHENPIGDESGDARVGWEVGHLPGIGAYGIDSWRIFCRDELRGLGTAAVPKISDDMDEEEKKGIEDQEMRREWTRVVPLDKELRAYLRWRWLRLGWDWDPASGERKRADSTTVQEAMKGGIICEDEVIQKAGSLSRVEGANGSDVRAKEGLT